MGVGKPHSNSLVLILEKKIQNTDIFNFIIAEAFQLSLNGRLWQPGCKNSTSCCTQKLISCVIQVEYVLHYSNYIVTGLHIPRVNACMVCKYLINLK